MLNKNIRELIKERLDSHTIDSIIEKSLVIYYLIL